MKGDFSKDSFHPEKHFHDVLMQQGRVLLDAEWNEQASINSYRTETGVRDIVGKSGTPFDEKNPDGGFQLVPTNSNTDVTITDGHYYVDGILCENESDVLYVNQPDYNSEKLPTSDGDYFFYLDVWQRHITVMEDAAIREVALGGPDTTTRTKTIWQVKWKGPASVNCANALDGLVFANPGKMMAKAKAAENSNDPCGLSESGGYTRLENQLYRAEIHIGGANRASSTFKWSRDNGIVIAKWDSQDSTDKNKLVVSTIGRDEILSFKEGEWIEIIDDRTDLLNKPGILVELQRVEGNTLVIKPSSIKDPDNPGAISVSILNRSNPRIRKWDSVADIKLTASWIALEDGVEVKFDEGTYTTGDYWLIPARTAIANVEWPYTVSQLPLGIKHHYGLLGILKLTAGVWSVVSDCRPLFPPLTDLISLFYVSGDGQEAIPGDFLPCLLKAGVANGEWPVNNATIEFKVVTGGGQFENGATTITVKTGVAVNPADVKQGVAEALRWKLGASGVQQVEARLLDASNVPKHLPVIFNANLSIASNVLYDDSGCDNWGGDPHNTVAEAITSLCKRKSGKKGCSFSVGKDGDFATLFEALTKLSELGAPDICLCLMPNEMHKIDRDIVVSNDKTNTIKISGCNAQIEMDEVKMTLVTEKIIFQGFNLFSKTIKKAQIFLSAEEIEITSCKFSRLTQDPSVVPFIIIGPAIDSMKDATIRIEKNNIISRATSHDKEFTDDVLALFNGVSGSMEHNVIEGIVRLQFGNNRFEPLKWVNEQEETQIFNRARPSIKRSSGNLTVRANIFENVFTNIFRSPSSDFMPVYKSLVITDNQFLGSEDEFIPSDDFKGFQNNSSFLAEFVTLCNNQLLEKDNHGEPVLCFAMGEAGMVIGNIGPARDNFRIEVKFNRQRIDPSLITVT